MTAAQSNIAAFSRKTNYQMRTGRISSQTAEHPAPQDVIRALLARMIERGSDSSWTHLEVVAEGGWFNNLLHGKQPWVEVAFANQTSLQLITGIPKKKSVLTLPIPAKWPEEKSRLWTVPISDLEELIAWVDVCLTAVSETTNYRVTGWIEGL